MRPEKNCTWCILLQWGQTGFLVKNSHSAASCPNEAWENCTWCILLQWGHFLSQKLFFKKQPILGQGFTHYTAYRRFFVYWLREKLLLLGPAPTPVRRVFWAKNWHTSLTYNSFRRLPKSRHAFLALLLSLSRSHTCLSRLLFPLQFRFFFRRVHPVGTNSRSPL